MLEKGRYTVLEGLDGIGKGVVQKVIEDYEEEKGKTLRDGKMSLAEFLFDAQESFEMDPNVKKGKYLLTVYEPSYFGVGLAIREEIIANNKRNYSSDTQIQIFSLDRLIQDRRVVIHYLKNWQDVLKVRNVTSTFGYQYLVASKEGIPIEKIRRKILEQEIGVLPIAELKASILLTSIPL